MSEATKTLTFVAVTFVACLAAYFSQPTSAEFNVEEEVGQAIFPDFETAKAKRLKVTRFDEEAATLSAFEVAQQGALWTIPSKGGYPADAEEQMAKSVDAVRGREILSVATQSAADHAEYGVVDPESPKLEVGQTGVGTRVTILDASNQPLADVIIGKPVKGSEDTHFVRRASQDAVYAISINPDDFSTDFENWIEDDLLKISPWDIQQVRLNDYSAKIFMTPGGLGVDTDYRSDLTLRYDDSESKWQPVELKKATDARKGEFESFTMGEDQELDQDKLNDLKNALDDLTIVDVARKPKGLSADLKAGEDFMNSNESLLSLIERGFAPVGSAQGAAELLASDGEVVCTMKDGVEYVLRFGDIQLDPGEEQAPADDEEASDKAGVNRYLFVMARFNESSIERPELEDLPELPEGATEEDEAAESSSDSEEDPSEDASDAADAADESSDAESTDDDASSDQSETEKALAERKAIKQRNDRKEDEYAKKIADGKQKVAQLNERFGDWYYVIPNDVFKKIHLGRDDVIKAKEAEEADGEQADGAADQSPLGAPGSPVPGLPSLPGLSDPARESEPPATEQAADEAEAEQADPSEADDEATGEEAGDSPATEEAADSGN